MRVERKSKVQDDKYNEFEKFNRKYNLISKQSSEAPTIIKSTKDYIDIILYDKTGKIIPQCKLGLKINVRI